MEGSGFGFQSFFTRDLNTFSRDGKDLFRRERLRQGQEDDPSDRQALHRSSPLFLCHWSEGGRTGRSRGEVAGFGGGSPRGLLSDPLSSLSCPARHGGCGLHHCHFSRGISVSNLPSLCLFPHLKYGTVTPTSEATVRTH